MPLNIRSVSCALLLFLGSVQGGLGQQNGQPQQKKEPQQKTAQQPRNAQQKSDQQQPNAQQKAEQQKNDQQLKKDQQQMRGLDEEVQEIKSDVLSISQELSRLEEKLLYPSGTQVAIFVAMAQGNQSRLDAVRVQIDGQLVAHYIYSFKELEALRKGGVQRLYVGNVSTGEHQLGVIVNGKLEGGADFSHTESFAFRKEVKPKMVELTLAGPESGSAPITLGEW